MLQDAIQNWVVRPGCDDVVLPGTSKSMKRPLLAPTLLASTIACGAVLSMASGAIAGDCEPDYDSNAATCLDRSRGDDEEYAGDREHYDLTTLEAGEEICEEGICVRLEETDTDQTYTNQTHYEGREQRYRHEAERYNYRRTVETRDVRGVETCGEVPQECEDEFAADDCTGELERCNPVWPQHQEQPAQQIADRFYCQADDHGVPTTYVSGAYATEKPLIRWVSSYFSDSGYDPMRRCEEVSDRFTRYYREGTLNYITTGIVNRLPVVCVSSQLGGPCNNVLLTLKPGQDATDTVQQLFDVRVGRSGPLEESGSRFYMDFNQHLQQLLRGDRVGQLR